MNRLKTIGMALLFLLMLPLLLVFIPAYLLSRLIWGGILRLWFWRAHAAQGRPILFVYSESPNWQDYVEGNILPRIRGKAVVLNWSERRLWQSRSPWEARFFYRFAGDRDFNPAALVFRPYGRIRVVRFHKAFRDFKHGKESALRAAESELISLAALDDAA